jgi:hypothetical protein
MAATAGAVVALVGCGGSAEDAVEETATKLGELRSGDLHLTVLASPRGVPLTRGTGFVLDGPFALGRPGRLPALDVRYTKIAGPRRGSVRLVSTGRRAFLEQPEGAYALGPAEQRRLRAAAGPPGGATGLERLHVEDWVVDPELSSGANLGGAETDRVTSAIDVVAAANALVAATGGPAEAIRGVDAERLRRAVRSSRLVLVTGSDDRLLRRLTVDLDLAADLPPVMRTQLGELGGARFRMDLSIDEPNRPVRVRAPEGARPPAL